MITFARSARAGRLLAVGIAVGVAVTALGAAPAGAKPLDHGPIFDEFSETLTNFCDVPGLTIEADTVVEGTFLANSRKPGTAPYFHENTRVEVVYSNTEGVIVTQTARGLSSDLKITDNGDGTLTILVLATGNAMVAGPDGKIIARNPGQVRFEVLIDHNDTIDDPSDDVFLEFLGLVKGSTGRTDDFCAAVVPILG
jgi:hypothetical protein